MCENCLKKASWTGWRDLPMGQVGRPLSGWFDLAHVVTENLSRSPAFPQPIIRKIVEMPRDNANVTEIHMVVHHGTHVDAPSHFFMDGPTFDQIPIERLYGPGVVWRIEKGPEAVIEVADFERATPKVRPGDIVMIDTGWAKKINTHEYEDHANFSREAAQWLVDNGVKLIGVDFSTPDLSSHRRSRDYDFPAHNTLLGQGVLIGEHFTNVAPLAGQRVEFMIPAIAIAGADGGQARPMARVVEA
jgi:arylformamidase